MRYSAEQLSQMARVALSVSSQNPGMDPWRLLLLMQRLRERTGLSDVQIVNKIKELVK